jgi:hypothetical protein
MTRDELIETMARAMAQQIAIEMMPPFADTPNGVAVPTVRLRGIEELPLKLLTAIETAGLAIVPVEATNAMICAGVSERHIRRVPFAWNKATVSVYRAMIEAGRI